MNIKLFFVLSVIVVSLQNCKKSEGQDYFTSPTDLVALYHLPDSFLCTAAKEVPGLGSVPWTANVLGGIRDGKLIITFITYEDSVNVHARERLSFNNIPLNIGKYIVESDTYLPFSNYSRWLSDGDVLNALWELAPEMDNNIEVVQLDSTSRTITGKFNVHFKITTQGSFGFVHSEKINFVNGKFYMKY